MARKLIALPVLVLAAAVPAAASAEVTTTGPTTAGCRERHS